MRQGALVVGTITRDYVESPAAHLDGELGGSAVYFALAARHFAPVTVVGPVGRDMEAELRRTLSFADLGAVSTVDSPTYAWHARRDSPAGDAETLERFGGSAEDYHPRVADIAGWPAVVFLGSCDPAAQLAVARAAPPGALVAADTMDVFISDQRDLVEQVVAASRILLATERELGMLAAGQPPVGGAPGDGAGAAAGQGPAAQVIARFGLDCVVVKRGSHGAELRTRTTAHELRALPVRAVDPTGAGDALAGGFLGRLAQKLAEGTSRPRPGSTEAPGPRAEELVEAPGLRAEELVEALGWGMACASFAVEQAGLRGLVAMTRELLSDRMSGYQPTTHHEVP